VQESYAHQIDRAKNRTLYEVGQCAKMLPVPSAPSLREIKKQRTVEAIASATVTLVAENGFEAVRVDDICAAAEVGRSTFFRYYDSKEAAFVHGVHQGRLDALLAALARRPADEDALTAARQAFLDVVGDWREQRAVLLLEAGIRASSLEVRARAHSESATWQEALATAFEDRLPRGRRRALHARLLAATVMAAVNIANEQWLADGGRRSPVARLTTAFDAVAELMQGTG
jgi:AcrR family transcriptional regulator